MPTLCAQLFGQFSIRRDGQVLDGFEARKVQELFCYLLLHRDHSLPRETLAAVLWPDTTAALSKKSLRQTLWQLQSALGTQAESATDRILLVGPDWVQLNLEADLRLDVAMFERAFEQTQKVAGAELDASQVQALEHAVQLYQGPLLEGWYQDWCLFERERLQSMYLAMLDKLMSYCEVSQDYETGLQYGIRIMCYDRARERTHRALMRLHYLNGDRSSALRQYEQCVSALDEELGVKPSKGTLALYDQILADQLEPPLPSLPAIEVHTAQAPSPTLHELLNDLVHLQTSLSDLQVQVQQSIQRVELVLGRDPW
jgi:DNA-binding SARP family transcriptional activator